jgi:hypothetical protein
MEEIDWKPFYIFFLFILVTFAKEAGYWVIWKVASYIRKSLRALKVYIASGASYLISLIIGEVGCCLEHVVLFLFLFFGFRYQVSCTSPSSAMQAPSHCKWQGSI